jgi:hypothetical protein
MAKCTFFLLLICCLSVTSVKASSGGVAARKPLESAKVSPEANLFKLLAVTPSGGFAGVAQIDDLAFAESIIHPWQSSHCDDPVMNYPRWEEFPVTLCKYTDIGVTVKTYMLNADGPKQARWIVTACHDAQASNMRKCIKYLVSEVRNASSGGVFPIAGYIPEPQDGGVCYVFRDGVTVWTEFRKSWLHPQNNHCGNSDEEEMTQPLFRAFKFARIASTTRPDYQAAGGTLPVNGLKWVEVVRDLYKKAWTSDRNELISAKAKAGKASGAFH